MDMLNAEQQEVIEAIKKDREQTQKHLAELQQLADQHAESIGNLVVGGSPVQIGGMTSDEYEIHAQAFFSEIRRQPVAKNDVDYEALRLYENAFPEWIRRGDAISGEFKNAMQIGSDPDGGFWTPPQRSKEILTRMFDSSPMRELCDQMTIDAHSIEFPVDSNDATSGGWVGETASRPETASPEVGLQTIYLREQYAMPIATQRLLDMSGIDIESWLTRKIADKLSRTENTAFVSGNGVASPRGFLDYKSDAVTTDDASRAWGVLQYVASGAAGAFPTVSGSTADDLDALITLQHSLKPEYLPNAVWLMARSTAAVVRKLKDRDGRWIWNDSLTEGGRPILLGHAVVMAEDMPVMASNSYSVAFGDFRRGYQILDHRVGVRILRDNLTTKGRVKFYTTKYTGGDLIDTDAIKILKFSVS
jgi:HK97 family phage major capsid protein